MSVVSITRFRPRAWRFVPLFMFHAQRSLVQIRRVDGYIAGAVRRDRDFAFWTATVWQDERALLAYVTSGAHRNAMPKLLDWGEEASTARLEQEGTDLPSWPALVQQMRKEGRAVPLRYPGPYHASVGFLDAEAVYMGRI